MAMRLGDSILSTGASGDQVKQIQQILQGMGYNVGGVDGIFGPNTQAAVQAFQSAHGLIADGIVGPDTWQALQGGVPVAVAIPPTVKPLAPASMFGGISTTTLLMAAGAVASLFLLLPSHKARR